LQPPMRFPFSAHTAAAVNGATKKIASPLYGSLAEPVSGVSGTANAAQSGASQVTGGSPMRSFVAVPASPAKGVLAPPVAGAAATVSPLRLRPDSGQVPAQAGSGYMFLGASSKTVPAGPVRAASPVQFRQVQVAASPLASPLRMRPGENVQHVRAASPLAVRAASPVQFRMSRMPPPNLVSQPPAVVRRTMNSSPMPNGIADPKHRWLSQDGASGSGMRYAPEGPTNFGHSHRSDATRVEGGD